MQWTPILYAVIVRRVSCGYAMRTREGGTDIYDLIYGPSTIRPNDNSDDDDDDHENFGHCLCTHTHTHKDKHSHVSDCVGINLLTGKWRQTCVACDRSPGNKLPHTIYNVQCTRPNGLQQVSVWTLTGSHTLWQLLHISWLTCVCVNVIKQQQLITWLFVLCDGRVVRRANGMHLT